MAHCDPLTPRNVKSPPVWDLRSDDFKLMMSMGDSVTAGLNAGVPYNPQLANKTYRDSVSTLEFRGMNFATGGNAETTSIGNALKFYSPDLIGLSNGTTRMTVCYDSFCLADSIFQSVDDKVLGLNAAFSGSWVVRMDINRQLSYLRQHVSKVVNNQEDWKLLTVTLGFNDVCVACYRAIDYLAVSADIHESDLRYLLQQVHDSFPKTFVVINSPFELSKLQTLIDADPVCPLIRKMAPGCFCLDSNSTQIMDQFSREYHNRTLKVVEEIQAQYSSDPYFGVVYDSGLFNLETQGTTAQIALSGMDCFHPSQSSHGRLGIQAFNNLFLKDKLPFSLVQEVPISCLVDSDRVWYPSPSQ